VKGKAIPVQAYTVLEGSRKLRLADFEAWRRLYPKEIFLVTISVKE
jgi:hypothetical protein